MKVPIITVVLKPLPLYRNLICYIPCEYVAQHNVYVLTYLSPKLLFPSIKTSFIHSTYHKFLPCAKKQRIFPLPIPDVLVLNGFNAVTSLSHSVAATHIFSNSKVLPPNNPLHLFPRISLTGLVNEERLPKTDKMLSEIGDGVIISRDRSTGDVTLTKLCRKDVFMMVKLLHLHLYMGFVY